MAFDFPSSPTNGQVFSPAGGPTYTWSSASGAWLASGSPTSILNANSDYRNKIINGDFAVDQRGASTEMYVTGPQSLYGPDRWALTIGQTPGMASMLRMPDPTYTSEYCMRVRCATIDTSLAAGDHHRVGQPIEGNMLRGLNWGTANAKAITVSFTAWASSGMTLPFCIRNPGNTRSWLASFAVTTTPQRFTFTIPGDTVGAWAYTNAVGMWFEIGLAVGTTYQAPATGWNSGDYITLAGMTNFMSSTSNMLYLKDVQLEEGSVATPFERRAYGSELLLCQRYFWKILAAANAERVPGSTGMAWSTNTTMHSLPTRVTMRSAPSIMATDLQINNNSAVFGDVTNFAASAASPDALNVNAQSSGTTWTVNSLVMLQFKTAGVSYIMATAEL